MIADTERFAFNTKPPHRGVTFPPPVAGDFPTECFKNSPLHYVRERTSDYVRQVLDAAPLQNNRAFIAVDIKVHQVMPGRYTCMPGWHCDTVIDPRQESPGEIHHLFVTGNAALTEFIAQPIELVLRSGKSGSVLLEDLRTQIDCADPWIAKLPSCQFVTYGRFDMHRASKGLFSETRLLVRLTETDVIRPVVQHMECKNF